MHTNVDNFVRAAMKYEKLKLKCFFSDAILEVLFKILVLFCVGCFYCSSKQNKKCHTKWKKSYEAENQKVHNFKCGLFEMKGGGVARTKVSK